MPIAIKTDRLRIMLIVFSGIIGVALRLYLAFYYRGNYDQESYEIVAQIMKAGKNLYIETYRYNYSPLWAYFLLALSKISALTDLPFHSIIRSCLTLVDFLNAWVLWKITDELLPGKGYISFVSYILNPVAILIVGYHGQFDTFATFPLLLAVYFTCKRPIKKPWVWILAIIALVIKHIVVFSVWTVFIYTAKSRIRAFLIFGFTVVIFLLSFSPFLPAAIRQILSNVILFGSITGMYGMGILFPHSLIYPIFVGMMFVLPLFANREMKLNLVKAIELSYVAFLAFTPGLGEQYFIYPVIWGSVYRTKWYWVFSLVAAIFLMGSKNNIHLPFPSLWNSVWIVAVGWFFSYFLTIKPKFTDDTKFQK